MIVEKIRKIHRVGPVFQDIISAMQKSMILPEIILFKGFIYTFIILICYLENHTPGVYQTIHSNNISRIFCVQLVWSMIVEKKRKIHRVGPLFQDGISAMQKV